MALKWSGPSNRTKSSPRTLQRQHEPYFFNYEYGNSTLLRNVLFKPRYYTMSETRRRLSDLLFFLLFLLFLWFLLSPSSSSSSSSLLSVSNCVFMADQPYLTSTHWAMTDRPKKGTQFFKKSRNYLKIVGATVQNGRSMVTYRPLFVHPCDRCISSVG